jgi:hypothetical protein
VGSVFNYVWRNSDYRYFCSNLYVIGGKMKITIEFDDVIEAKQAIHAHDVWTAMLDINEAIRSHTKHDVSETQTIASIQEILSDVSQLLYS